VFFFATSLNGSSQLAPRHRVTRSIWLRHRLRGPRVHKRGGIVKDFYPFVLVRHVADQLLDCLYFVDVVLAFLVDFIERGKGDVRVVEDAGFPCVDAFHDNGIFLARHAEVVSSASPPSS